jgi:hypothetical protein
MDQDPRGPKTYGSGSSTLIHNNHIMCIAVAFIDIKNYREHQELDTCGPIIADIRSKLKSQSEGIDLD